jgi:dihydroorotase
MVSTCTQTLLRCVLALIAALGIAAPAAAQTAYSLVIKGGHVLDPKNGRDGVMDVAVADGKIAEVAPSIDASKARRVVDARGLYVVPGLIDLHAHVFFGTDADGYLSNGPSAVAPDNHSFRNGQTTLVDVGGAGWRSFPQFKAQIIDTSRTRVLSFLNIVSAGMRGGPAEQNLADMDAKLTAMRIRQHPGLIVGIKVAHYMGPEWDPVTRAVEAGTEADVPVMIDFGGNTPPLSLDELLNKRLRPGDLLTHMYAHVRGRQPIVDEQGQLEPFVAAARKRGVLFDVGHGGGSFLWRQAIPATKQGFFPDVVSTDLHTGSMNAGMKDILNVMSKMMALGMPLTDVIRANTVKAAEVIKRADLGHLAVGTEADIAVLAVRKGEFGFIDSSGGRFPATQKLECEVTVRAGQVVWDLNGRAAPLWSDMPATPQGAGPGRPRRTTSQERE